MNDNGSWLIQFAVSWNMIIGSVSYPHKDIHKSTWRSLDGVTFSGKDHILIDRRQKSNQGAKIDSDHCLVIACLRAQISNVKRVTEIRTNEYNISKLAEQYR
jgi:hypothetical protein